MRKKFFIFAVLALAFMGFLIASPFIAVSQMKRAIIDRDSKSLCERIDFQSLRKNLKNQFTPKLLQMRTTNSDNNFHAPIPLTFAFAFIDGLVEVLVTPAGVAALLEQGELFEDVPELEKTFRTFTQMSNKSRFSFNSVSSFSLHILNANEEKIEFSFQRNGFHWKLTNVIVPEHNRAFIPQNMSGSQTVFVTDYHSLSADELWHSIKMGAQSRWSSGLDRKS
jgi:hypothetical protein